MTEQEHSEETAIRLPKIEEIEKDYKEWCVNLIKVRFDLKPEYYDEHHHNNYTYENCADCLWNRIKGTIEELLWLKEEYYKLHEQLILWKNRAEQAVKDTAKEICDLILEHWQGHDLVECDWLIVTISEKYGVDMK